jgi:hypothetical protein
LLLFLGAYCTSISAIEPAPEKLDLPYPKSGEALNAEDIIYHVWYVNHFRSVENYSIAKKGNNITWLAYRSSKGKFRFRTLERYLKNIQDPEDEEFTKDIVIFHYPGAIDGTGLLITDYRAPGKSQSLTVWLPALRKPRRFSQPHHADSYAGSDWTYGDVSLRKPWHESHELLRTEPFSQADEGGNKLHTIDIPETYKKDFMTWLPSEQDLTIDRECYVVRSDTFHKDYWYDYRVSWIDTETFADYRTLYYKNDKLVKIVDRLWRPMKNHPGSEDVDDPRAQYWVMWYGKTLRTGHESMAIIPPVVNAWNSDLNDRLWTIPSLEKLKR